MDEVEELWNVERKMKLQEKYRLITQRVLNPHANPYTGSMAILYSLVGPNLQKRSYPSQRFKGHKRLVPFRSRNLKIFTMLNPYERRRRDFPKKEKGNNELHP